MSDGIDHLDWELDEGWVPLHFSTGDADVRTGIDWVAAPGPHGVVQFVPRGGWGTVTHFQTVPRIDLDDKEAILKDRPSPWLVAGIMTALAIPFWLLAGYGLYRLVAG